MQLIIKTDLTVLPSVIETNYDEVKNWLAEQLEKYQSLVFTEDAMKDAKADRAALNKMADALNEEKKRIKNILLTPYSDFEKKVKELMGMVEAPKNAIDLQIKEYEGAKREEKESKIRELYADAAGDLLEVIPFEKIFSPKWLNATVSMKSIGDEITTTFARIRSDLVVIDTTLNDAQKDIVKDKYLTTLDLSSALAEGKAYETRQKALENARAAKEAAAPPPPPPIDTAQAVDVEYEEVPEERALIKFWVKVTAEQKRMLGEFLRNSNIEFGGIG